MVANLNLITAMKNLSDFELNTHHANFIDYYRNLYTNPYEIFIYRAIQVPNKKQPEKFVSAFEIIYAFYIEPYKSKVKREFLEEQKTHKRQRLGNNLYLEFEINNRTSIYMGNIPFSKIGHGVKEDWEFQNDKWIKINSRQTWIS